MPWDPMKKKQQNKTRSVFWYAGLCVGSTVLAGKTVTGAFGSGVSSVGGVCRRAIRIEKTAVKDAVEEDRTPKAERSGLVASVAHFLNPIAMAGSLATRLKRVQVAPRKESNRVVLAVAAPVVNPIPKVAVPIKPDFPHAPQPRETNAISPVKPVVKETPKVDVSSKPDFPHVLQPRDVGTITPVKPVTREIPKVIGPGRPEAPPSSYRREKVFFAEVTPEEADAAEFDTSVHRIVFRKALSDLSRPDSATRVHAASVAGGIPHPLSMRAVAFQLLRDESAEVRRACVAALAALSNSEGFAAAEHALQDGDISVRVAAVIAVYRLGGPRSAGPLALMLRDPDAEVRRMAVSCIGWLHQKDLSGQIAPLLNDDSAHVRLSAVEATSTLRGHEAVPALIERLADSAEAVRRKTFSLLQEVTGRKMGERYPASDAERNLLMARWRHWWKEEAGRESFMAHSLEYK